jgi:hypothetical protein
MNKFTNSVALFSTTLEQFEPVEAIVIAVNERGESCVRGTGGFTEPVLEAAFRAFLEAQLLAQTPIDTSKPN